MKKTDKQKGWRTCGAIGNPHGCRYVNGTILWKKGLAVFYETIHLIKDPMISYLDVYSRWIKTCIYTHTYNLNKNVHGSFIHNIKKKKIVNSPGIHQQESGKKDNTQQWKEMNHWYRQHELILKKMLSERSIILCMISFIWSFRTGKFNLWGKIIRTVVLSER